MSGGTGSGPDLMSAQERAAIARRDYLRELLQSTCIHLHAPEACQWCIRKELDRIHLVGDEDDWVECDAKGRVTATHNPSRVTCPDCRKAADLMGGRRD